MSEEEFDKKLRELQIECEVYALSEMLVLYYKYYGGNVDKVKPKAIYTTIHSYKELTNREVKKVITSALDRVKNEYNLSIK